MFFLNLTSVTRFLSEKSVVNKPDGSVEVHDKT